MADIPDHPETSDGRGQFPLRRRDLMISLISNLVNGHAKAKVLLNQHPEIFSYPAPYRRADGSIMSNPVAIDLGSFTNNFPTIPELTGVIVMPYWSMINPKPKTFDFSLIEKALDYWRGMDRKIVLGVVTYCYPTRSVSGKLIEAVPSWVVERSKTYRQAVRVIGSVKPLGPDVLVDAVFPTYWDDSFQQAEAELVRALGRFDGHPALSKIRVCTGIMGEDNPTFDGLRASMPGFSSLAWINYSSKVLDIYREAFSRTQLEFDIDRVGFIKALGDYGERKAADIFMQKIKTNGIFLAMNGLDVPNVKDWLAGVKSGPGTSLNYIMQQKNAGHAVGLESGNVSDLSDMDVDLLAKAFRSVSADRLVTFSDAIAAINWCRNGSSEMTETSETIYGASHMAAIGALGQRLLYSLVSTSRNPHAER